MKSDTTEVQAKQLSSNHAPDTFPQNRYSGGRLFRWLVKPLEKILHSVGEIIYGATIYEMVRELYKERAYLEHLFILIVFGDLLGIPVLPPYYTLRLLPYVVPSITGWKRSLLRERDLTDLCDQEIT